MGGAERSKELHLVVQASIAYKGAILQCNVVCLYTQQEHEEMFKKNQFPSRKNKHPFSYVKYAHVYSLTRATIRPYFF